jgi:hypothetical protein
MADAATIVGPRKTKEQLEREHQIYLERREKEGVLRRLLRKAPGVEWQDTHAVVPTPGPKGSVVTYKVWLAEGWQKDVKKLTPESIVKLTKSAPVKA